MTKDDILQSTKSPISIQKTAFLLLSIFVSFFVLSFILPWQQTSIGAGRVIAYAQKERQQFIDAPIKGLVIKWFVREGQIVKKGDKIVEIRDNDPDYLDRMQLQRDAIRERILAATDKMSSTSTEVANLRISKLSVRAAYESKIHNAEQKVLVAKENIKSSAAAVDVAFVNLKRQKTLFSEGLTSKRKLELSELKHTKLKIELEKNKRKLISAKATVTQLKSEMKKELSIVDAKVASSRAKVASARSDVTKAKESLPKIEAHISRQQAQVVYAPKDGKVMRLMAQEGSDQVKAGDNLATLIPSTNARAVELWVNSNDIPLIHQDQEVRLQFQGYPAIQLSGWPELAVGTFGGTVAFVDNTDQGGGNFRVVVIPKTDEVGWPDGKYLRQGVRCKGWIFLNRVSIAFELWRKFNDFPPALPGPTQKKYQEKSAKKSNEK